jgi:hypothetical protein
MDYPVTITVTRTHTLTLPSSRWAELAGIHPSDVVPLLSRGAPDAVLATVMESATACLAWDVALVDSQGQPLDDDALIDALEDLDARR